MINLEIVTPQRSLPVLICNSVTLPGKDGQFEVLPGHAALMAEIKTGFLSFQPSNTTHADLSSFAREDYRVMVAEGFVEVLSDTVRLLCSAVALPSEVSATSEEDMIAQLKERMKTITAKSNKELKRLGAELETVMTHL